MNSNIIFCPKCNCHVNIERQKRYNIFLNHREEYFYIKSWVYNVSGNMKKHVRKETITKLVEISNILFDFIYNNKEIFDILDLERWLSSDQLEKLNFDIDIKSDENEKTKIHIENSD